MGQHPWGAEVGGPIFEPCKTAGEGAAVSHVLVLGVSFCCQGKALGVHSSPEFALVCIALHHLLGCECGSLQGGSNLKKHRVPGPIESPARRMLQEGGVTAPNPHFEALTLSPWSLRTSLVTAAAFNPA